MADYEDYEVVTFPDFKEFTCQFEKKEEKGKGKSDPNIHQKKKANSLFSNCDYCPQPPLSTLALSMSNSTFAPVCPLALEVHGSYPCWKWIPETQLCEQERNEFSLNGQSLLERYNKIKGTNFEFVRLVKIQLIPSSGITYFIQFEAKPNSIEYTLKTFEGSMFKSYVHSNSRLWPMSCKLLCPNSQRYVLPGPSVWTI
ncbi:uncharacterized protein LOC126692397 [Quercus robur]|uniref:uncharacterized protein LOC126692397 n=1 Tax=Quercus robur TaxID=38942 RepID=UPI0021621B68|nr:uncharacterized protein LOC126692397 [Quercus robur]